MLALSDTVGVVLLVLGGIFVVAASGALLLRSRGRREAVADIPRGMRPGPSDGALEAPLLHKMQGWGLVLVTFFVVWIPVYWLAEPGANLQQEEDLKAQAIERGELSVELFSEENQLGVGCVRCHGPELRGSVITAGSNPDGTTAYAYPPDLTNLCAGPFGNPQHNAIASVQDIYQVLEQGRNAMPSWSIRYQGALDDQQINDLVNYLVAMSSENVPFEDNVCINPDASARAVEQAAAAGTVLERP
jgi:mono/diheme cytochrome c family protein